MPLSRETLVRPLARNAPLFAAVLVHAAAAALLGVLLGVGYEGGMAGALIERYSVLVPIFLMLLLVWRVLVMAVVHRPRRPIDFLLKDLRRILLDPERIVAGLMALLALAVFSASFSFVKPLIPELRPFDWDASFAALDRALHGGRDPYVLLMPVFGHPAALKGLSIAYHAWFFLFYFVSFVACFSRPSGRSVFLLAFVLTLAIGGNLLATLLSSAGPVYYERLGFGDDFVPLMTFLHQVDAQTSLPVLRVQELLWETYAGAGPSLGISAMPSMHVAMAVLMALYGFRCARWAGICLTLFAVTIAVGSVMLGWHYAVDAYAGALVALGAWAVARWLVEGGRRGATETPGPVWPSGADVLDSP